MVRRPPVGQDVMPPQDFASAPPRDIAPMADIRVVMTELSKLSTIVERMREDIKDHGTKIDDVRIQVTSKLDRAVHDVKEHGEKIDKLRHQATSIQVGLVVAGAALGLLGWFLDHLLDGKFEALAKVIAATHK